MVRQRCKRTERNFAGIGRFGKFEGWIIGVSGFVQFCEPFLVLLPLSGQCFATAANVFSFLAGLVTFAFIAILWFADGFLLGRDEGVIGGDRAHDFAGFDCGCGSFDDLHGDLKTVQEESGASGVNGVGSELGEDLSEGELDGAPVFNGLDDEVWRLAVGRSGSGGFAEVGMEVAERLIAQGRGMAA